MFVNMHENRDCHTLTAEHSNDCRKPGVTEKTEQFPLMKIKTGYIVAALMLMFAFPVNKPAASSTIKIYVSILPQKYFVERIGKDRVKVNVLVKPGKSPATYSPSPDQIKELDMSDFYFKIGVPFENSILHKIESMDKIKIIDINRNVVLRDMAGHHHEHEKEWHGHKMAGKDPHSWMDPVIVKKQAETIFHTLAEFDPGNRKAYKKNYLGFIKELDELDKNLHAILNTIKGKTIFVFHPFLGYFTDAYHLHQTAIETMGKAPKGKELAKIIKLAKQQNIKTIFVQPQFDRNAANKIAEIIKGRVVSVNPLAYNYPVNMKNIALTISRELKE